MEGKKTSISTFPNYTLYLKLTPPLPSEYRGWNAGKGDCGHYRSHLDFSVHIGTKPFFPGPCEEY